MHKRQDIRIQVCKALSSSCSCPCVFTKPLPGVSSHHLKLDSLNISCRAGAGTLLTRQLWLTACALLSYQDRSCLSTQPNPGTSLSCSPGLRAA